MSKRFKRWKAKTDPDTTYMLLKLTRELAIEKEQEYQPKLHELNMKVKNKLCEIGVPSIYHHYYIHLAQGFWYLQEHHKKSGVCPEAEALAMYWWFRGLDPDVIYEIAKLFNFEVWTLLEEKLKQALETAKTLASPLIGRHPLKIEFIYDASGNLIQIKITDKITGEERIKDISYTSEGNIETIEDET